MTELVITKCIAPNCEREAALSSVLCRIHGAQLQRTEANLLKDATRWVKLEMRQFERLMLVEPLLHSAELAHRMAWPMKKVRQMLRKFRDDRA